MAKPPRTKTLARTGNLGLGPDDIDPPDVPPLDPDEIRQRHLLAEAVLVSFTATPGHLPPFGQARLAWNIKMPTTVLPGVNVEVHLAGAGDQVVDPAGSRLVAPYGDTTYAIYLRAPLVSRHLGTLDLTVDFDGAACRAVNVAPGVFIQFAKDEANRAVPAGAGMTFRGAGSSIDIGYNSFVVDLPLRASVPDWFDPDVDVTMGFNIASEDGQVRVTNDLAKTDVSVGAWSAIFSVGCATKVATAVEATSDGFLSGFVGPVVASRLRDQLVSRSTFYLNQLNQTVPPPVIPYRFYDLSLTALEGLTFRYCPKHAAQPGLDPSLGGGGVGPIHS